MAVPGCGFVAPVEKKIFDFKKIDFIRPLYFRNPFALSLAMIVIHVHPFTQSRDWLRHSDDEQ
jgi:hypothetical protein